VISPRTRSIYQRPRLEVYIDDIRVPRVASIRISRTLQTSIAKAEIVLPNPVPDHVKMGARVVIQAGVSRFVARFTGYLTLPGSSIWPGRLTFRCEDVLSNAAMYFPLDDFAVDGLQDQNIVQTVLEMAGFSPVKLHIQGQSVIVYPSEEDPTTWPPQESAQEVYEEVDKATPGTWRTWAEPDGHIYRRSFNGPALLSPIRVYEEGRDFTSGDLTLERRDPKAVIAQLGQDVIDSIMAGGDPDIDPREGPFWDRYRYWDAHRDESPYPSDPERTQAWMITKIFDTVVHVSLTVFDDEPFMFGSTFRVVAPRSRTNALVWTQSQDIQLDSNSRWRMQLGGVALLDDPDVLPMLPVDSGIVPPIAPIPPPGSVPPGRGVPLVKPPVRPPLGAPVPPAPAPAPPPPAPVPPGTGVPPGGGGGIGGPGEPLPPAVTAVIEPVAMERELRIVTVTEVIDGVEVTHEVEREVFVARVKNASTSTGGTVVSVTWSTTGDASVAGYGPATLPDGLYFTTAFAVLAGSEIHLSATDSTGLVGTASLPMDADTLAIVKRKLFAMTETEVEEFDGTDWQVQTPTTPPISQSTGGPVWGTGADLVLVSADALATIPTEVSSGLGTSVPVVFNDDGDSLIIAVDPTGTVAASDDDGATWTTGDPLPGEPRYLFKDPSGPIRAATTAGLFSSGDGGLSWSTVREGGFEMWALGSIRHAVLMDDFTAETESGTPITGASDLAAVAVDHVTDEIFAVGTDGTGYKTDPGGTVFTAQPGTIPAGVEIRGMLQDPVIDKLFYLACGSGGVYKTIDGFATEGGVMQIRKPGVGSSPADANYMALGVGASGVSGGFTWIAASSASHLARLRNDGSGEAVTGSAQVVVAGPQQSQGLFADLFTGLGANFAHSSDQGATWSGFTEPGSGGFESAASSIAAGAANTGYMMTKVSTLTPGENTEARLWKTTNGGASWSMIESVVTRPNFSTDTGFELFGIDLWANAASVWWPIRQVTGTATSLTLLRRSSAGGGGGSDVALSGTQVTGVKPNHDNTDSALVSTDASVFLLTGGSASDVGSFVGFDLWGSTIYATTGSSIRKSTNGGASWTTIATLTEALGAIQFSESSQDRLIVCAAGSNKFWITNDAGTTWTLHTIADWAADEAVNTLVVF
jgi:hypothetical protein